MASALVRFSLLSKSQLGETTLIQMQNAYFDLKSVEDYVIIIRGDLFVFTTYFNSNAYPKASKKA